MISHSLTGNHYLRNYRGIKLSLIVLLKRKLRDMFISITAWIILHSFTKKDFFLYILTN